MDVSSMIMKRNSSLQISRIDLLFDVINYFLMSMVLVIILYPLVYVVSASFSDPFSVASGKMWLLPHGFTLDGYKRLLNYSEIWVGYGNTIFYTFLGTMLNLAVTLPCAYAISRKDFIGRKIITIMFMITMFFGGGLIPTYILMQSLGIYNNRAVLLISGLTSAYNTFIARTFFQTTVPDELVDSSRIDGCSNWRLFIKIVLPLSKPIIAVLGMYFAVAHWNSYFTAMIYLQDRSLFPLQLILREILVQSKVAAEMAMYDTSIALTLAEQAKTAELLKYTSIIVATIPMLVFYICLQRYFVQGIMLGSVKG
jgi:putative aldouronate transport system permease protein